MSSRTLRNCRACRLLSMNFPFRLTPFPHRLLAENAGESAYPQGPQYSPLPSSSGGSPDWLREKPADYQGALTNDETELQRALTPGAKPAMYRSQCLPKW